MKPLHLNLKDIYFQEIKSGIKIFEYRLATPYWEKRLVGREYSAIVVKSGYPSRSDLSRQIIRPWLGYEIHTINHPHFGGEPVEVFAIRVNPE